MDKFSGQPKKQRKGFTNLMVNFARDLAPWNIWKIIAGKRLLGMIKFNSERPIILPSYNVLVDNDLYFTVSVYAWHLPDDHEICEKYFRSLWNVFVWQLLFEVATFNICPGIDGISDSESYMLHVVPQEATAEFGQPGPKVFWGLQTVFYW